MASPIVALKDGIIKGFCNRQLNVCKCLGPILVCGCQCWHGLGHGEG